MNIHIDKIENEARHPKLVNLPNLRVIGLNTKAWYTFKNR